MAAAGVDHQDKINRYHVNRRIIMSKNMSYAEIYPYVTEGAFLSMDSCPESWKRDVAMATADSFQPRFEEVYIEED